MTQPKFSVGEQVILQSKGKPQYNGEYIVQGIAMPGKFYRGIEQPVYCTIGYDLGIVITENFLDVRDGYSLWCESALRKKHQPSTESFSQIMNGLKQPQNV
jgi:hypothetical protein